MKFSIIIPFYNSEKYIERCIKSVLEQSFGDYEIILINDGSTDRSSSVISNIDDDRITVLENSENRGVSYSRNKGIKQAKGEWITFLDSDDWFDKNTLKEVSGIIDSNDKVDLVQCNLMIISDIDRKPYSELMDGVVERKSEIIESIISVEYGIRKYAKYGNCRCAGGKFYKRDLIKNTSFRCDLKTFEDGIFNLEAYNNASQIYITNEPMYNYFRVGQSATKSYNPNLDEQISIILSQILQCVKNDSGYRESYAHCKFGFMIRSIYNSVLNDRKYRKNYINGLVDRNKKGFLFVNTAYLGKRDKLYFWLAKRRFCFLLFCSIKQTMRYFDR